MENLIKQADNLEAALSTIPSSSAVNADQLRSLLNQFKQVINSNQKSADIDNESKKSTTVTNITTDTKTETEVAVKVEIPEPNTPKTPNLRRSKRKRDSEKTESGLTDADTEDYNPLTPGIDLSYEHGTDSEGSCDPPDYEELSPRMSDGEQTEGENVAETEDYWPIKCQICEMGMLMSRSNDGVVDDYAAQLNNEAHTSSSLANTKSVLLNTSSDSSTGADVPEFYNWSDLCDHVRDSHCVFDGSCRKDGMKIRDGKLHNKQGKEVKSKTTIMKYSSLACPRCSWVRKVGSAYYKGSYLKLCFHLHSQHRVELPEYITVYKCDNCDYKTNIERYLDEHVLYNHSGVKTKKNQRVSCTECGKSLLQRFLATHMYKTHHIGQPQLQSTKLKAKIDRWSCPQCEKTFSAKNLVQRHINRVHNQIKENLCHVCSTPFFAYGDLIIHLYEKHKLNLQEKPVFKCSFEGCDYSSLSKDLLARHSISAHGERLFICVHCVKTFKTLNNLKQHENVIHPSGEKLYKCDQCDFSSHVEQYLKRHMKIHSDVKQFKCKHLGCNYETHFSENLTKHKKIHLNSNATSKRKSTTVSVTSVQSKRRKSLKPSQAIPDTSRGLLDEGSPFVNDLTTASIDSEDAGAVKPPANIQQILNQAYSLSSGLNTATQFESVLVLPFDRRAPASEQHKQVMSLDHVTNTTPLNQQTVYQCNQQQFDTSDINNGASRQYLSL